MGVDKLGDLVFLGGLLNHETNNKNFVLVRRGKQREDMGEGGRSTFKTLQQRLFSLKFSFLRLQHETT